MGPIHILDEFTSVLTRQPVKNATLEHSYKKRYFTPGSATSLSGYGFTHDGSGFDIPRGHEYEQDRFRDYPNAARDVTAFLFSMQTDTAPAVGSSCTIGCDSSAAVADPGSQRIVLEAQAAAGKL